MTEFCRTDKVGHILRVTLDRPEVMNALHRPANLELEAIWDSFEADDNLWIAVLTGAGERAFSAGNDLKYQAAGNDTTIPVSGFGGITARRMTKPVTVSSPPPCSCGLRRGTKPRRCASFHVG